MRASLSFLLALSFVAPAASAAALYRCTMTGNVHLGRCCPRLERERSRKEAVAPEDCCQLVDLERESSPSADSSRSSSFDVIAAAPSSAAPPIRAPRQITGVPRSPSTRAPPARDLWLITRSLLL